MKKPSTDVAYYSGRAAIVTLHGEHDLALKPELVRALATASFQRNVLVDFSPCTFADSSVLSALLQAAPPLQRRGGLLQLVIPAQRPGIRRVFELMGLQRHLPIHPTLEAAIDYIDSERSATVQKTPSGMRLGVLAVLSLEASADYEPPLPRA
jgi:anti-anti-sigma factor